MTCGGGSGVGVEAGEEEVGAEVGEEYGGQGYEQIDVEALGAAETGELRTAPMYRNSVDEQHYQRAGFFRIPAPVAPP